MAGVTPNGIHYPDGASKAKNLGPELERMANDIDTYIGSYLIPTGPIRQIVIGITEEIVPPMIPPLVEEYLDGKGFVDGEATYEPIEGVGDYVSWGLIDAAGKRLPLEFDWSGHWSPRARYMMVEDTYELMREKLGITDFYGEGFGIGGEITDNSGKVLMRFDERGHLVHPRISGQDTASSTLAISDIINEWWTEPGPLFDRGRWIVQGNTTDGMAALGELRPGVPGRSVILGEALQDDHCAGTCLVLGDGSLFALWNLHGQTSTIPTMLGAPDGSIDSVAQGIGKFTTIPVGGGASYNQVEIIRHLSNASRTVMYCFTRKNGAGWGIVPITVDLITREVTWGEYIAIWSTSRQSYVTLAAATNSAGEQVLRFGAYYNPQEFQGGPIWTFELNVVTGDFSAPDRSLVGKLGVDVIDQSGAASLPALAITENRRLFYVGGGPAGWAIAYAEGSVDAPDGWRYQLAEWDGSTWAVSDLGPAGTRIGYNPNANYLGGMSLPSVRYGRSAVAVARNTDSGGTLEVFRHNGTEWVSKSIAQSNKIARPRFTPAGIFYADIEYYGADYREYAATMRVAQEGRS